MITTSERNDWAERFGVAPGQVERDHLISCVLHAISRRADAGFRFFGGTALCRTYLDGSRLSEDIDLLHTGPRQGLATLIEVLPRELTRDYPSLAFAPGQSDGDGRSAMLEADDVGQPVKLYVGRFGSDTSAYTFRKTQVSLRYSDLPKTVPISCPTLSSFVAMKTAAWYDRHTPRDLFDLSGLARIGAFDRDAEQALRAAVGAGFVPTELLRLPSATRTAWNPELAGQIGSLPTAEACLADIERALDRLRDEAKSD